MKLKNKSIVGAAMSLLFVIGLFAFASINVSAQEEKQDSKLAKQAKITMAQARQIAHKKASGKIEGEELEKEHGKLIYSFDIRNAKGTITEVQVDAKTGAIVSVEEENKAAEQKEKQQDKKEKSKKKKS
jgi:lipopolysaccharide export LptBFGC system permease protein LptF